MNRESYALYLKSGHWRMTRESILRKRGYMCQQCDSENDIHVHHLTYANLGHERDEDLVVLCADCHAKIHGRAPREPKPIQYHTSRPTQPIQPLLRRFGRNLVEKYEAARGEVA